MRNQLSATKSPCANLNVFIFMFRILYIIYTIGDGKFARRYYFVVISLSIVFAFTRGPNFGKHCASELPEHKPNSFTPLRKPSGSFFSDCMTEHFVPPVSDCCDGEPFISGTARNKSTHPEQIREKPKRRTREFKGAKALEPRRLPAKPR